MTKPLPLDALIRELKLVVFDFDGVFTDNRVLVGEDGKESVLCNRSDGLGLRRLESVGVSALILSTEENPVVAARAKKLRIECRHGCSDKLEVLNRILEQRGLVPRQVAYVGNDINDASCLRHVGLPVVVADAWPEVKPLALVVLERSGGEGAVREFCDRVWAARRGGAGSYDACTV